MDHPFLNSLSHGEFLCWYSLAIVNLVIDYFLLMRFVTCFSFRSFVFSLDPVVEIEDEVIDCVMQIVNLKSDVNSPRSIRVSFLVLVAKLENVISSIFEKR